MTIDYENPGAITDPNDFIRLAMKQIEWIRDYDESEDTRAARCECALELLAHFLPGGCPGPPPPPPPDFVITSDISGKPRRD